MRERGSVCIYVSVLMVSLGLLTAALVPLATGLRARTTRRTDELRARMAFEAGVALAKSHTLTMSATIDAPITVTLNGATASVTPTTGYAALAKSILVTGTATRNGRVYRFSRVIGYRIPSPFSFALLTDGKFDMNARLTTGTNGGDGDVYSGDEFKVVAAGGTINGNVVAKKAIATRTDTVVTGLRYPNYTDIAWPTVSASDYAAEATALSSSGLGTTYSVATTLNGVAFPSAQGDAYPIVYCGNDLNLKGTISGRGTIFVNGDLNITGDLLYASSSSLAAIVVKGKITVSSTVSTVYGVLYSNTSFASQSASLTIPRGMVVTKTVASDTALSIVRDNVARDDADEATRLRLPYYWP